MPESPPQLKPLSPGEIIDEAIDLLRSNWRLFFGISAIVVFPTAAIGNLLSVSSGYAHATWLPVLLMTIPGLLALTAVVAAGSERYLGRPATMLGAYGYALRRIPDLLVTALAMLAVFAAAAFVLFVALILASIIPLSILAPLGAFSGHHVPAAETVLFYVIYALVSVPVLLVALIIYSRLSLAWVAFYTEHLWGFGAFTRSWDLVKGRIWQSAGVIALTDIIAAAVTWIPVWILRSVVGHSHLAALVAAAFAGLAATIGLPLREVPRIALYFDLRVRKEGYDLQLMAQREAPPPPAPIPQE